MGHLGTDGVGYLGIPPLLPSPALLAAQSWGDYRWLDLGPTIYQGGERRPGWCGLQKQHGRNCYAVADDLWREQGQHDGTTMCYSIAEWTFPTPSRKDSERNFI